MRGSPVCIYKQTYHMRTLKYAIVLSELAKEKECENKTISMEIKNKSIKIR